jgi:hypothetical protein
MSDIITPDQIAFELRQIRSLADKGPDELKRAEARYEAALDAWQGAWDEGYSQAEGTIAEREIAARRLSAGLKTMLNEEKTELNRVKARIRSIESAQMNLQTQLKAVLVTYQEAGR